MMVEEKISLGRGECFVVEKKKRRGEILLDLMIVVGLFYSIYLLFTRCSKQKTNGMWYRKYWWWFV